jgi:tripartite-type tricarboxylate transporter receptor subunit TctC
MTSRAFSPLRRSLGLALGLAATLGLVSHSAHAQTFPTKPVRIITPFPVGGGPDGVARIVAEKLGRIWNQPVVVENRPGGNGFIAIDAFKRGAKDGHDLIVLDNVHLAAYPSLFKKLPYDVAKDFDTLLPLFKTHFFFTVGTGSKYKTVAARDLHGDHAALHLGRHRRDRLCAGQRRHRRPAVPRRQAAPAGLCRPAAFGRVS